MGGRGGEERGITGSFHFETGVLRNGMDR